MNSDQFTCHLVVLFIVLHCAFGGAVNAFRNHHTVKFYEVFFLDTESLVYNFCFKVESKQHSNGGKRQQFDLLVDSPEADRVALMIHNAIRITHNIPELVQNAELKALAAKCAEYHATVGPDPPKAGVQVPPCPYISESRLPAAESVYGHEIALGVPGTSQMYRTALWSWYYQIDPVWSAPEYGPLYHEKVQMIWKATTQFACAVSKNSSRPPSPHPGYMYICCMYSPPGNVRSKLAFAQNVLPDVI